MREVLLERGQLILTLPGNSTAWQRLPAPVREAVIEVLSRLMVEHIRRERTDGRQEQTGRGREHMTPKAFPDRRQYARCRGQEGT